MGSQFVLLSNPHLPQYPLPSSAPHIPECPFPQKGSTGIPHFSLLCSWQDPSTVSASPQCPILSNWTSLIIACVWPLRHPSSLCPDPHLTLQFSQSCLSSFRNSKRPFSVWSVPNSQSSTKSFLTWPANTLFFFLLYWRPGSPWQHCFPAALSCQMAAIFPHYPWTMIGVG